MLPDMLMLNLVDTHWFWNYEQRMATDFEGSQVALYETVAEGPLAEEDCTGHIASAHDPKICGICGVHIDSLRPPEGTEQDILPTIATYIELPANADVAKEFAKLLEASPDANCHTLPNGDCVSEGPCMHTPTPTPKQSWRRI